jgi:hypothetical protein
MSGDVVTSAAIRRAIALVEENRPYRPCPHVVHPMYTGWEVITDKADPDLDVYVPCAMLCGGGVVFRRLAVVP